MAIVTMHGKAMSKETFNAHYFKDVAKSLTDDSGPVMAKVICDSRSILPDEDGDHSLPCHMGIDFPMNPHGVIYKHWKKHPAPGRPDGPLARIHLYDETWYRVSGGLVLPSSGDGVEIKLDPGERVLSAKDLRFTFTVPDREPIPASEIGSDGVMCIPKRTGAGTAIGIEGHDTGARMTAPEPWYDLGIIDKEAFDGTYGYHSVKKMTEWPSPFKYGSSMWKLPGYPAADDVTGVYVGALRTAGARPESVSLWKSTYKGITSDGAEADEIELDIVWDSIDYLEAGDDPVVIDIELATRTTKLPPHHTTYDGSVTFECADADALDKLRTDLTRGTYFLKIVSREFSACGDELWFRVTNGSYKGHSVRLYVTRHRDVRKKFRPAAKQRRPVRPQHPLESYHADGVRNLYTTNAKKTRIVHRTLLGYASTKSAYPEYVYDPGILPITFGDFSLRSEIAGVINFVPVVEKKVMVVEPSPPVPYWWDEVQLWADDPGLSLAYGERLPKHPELPDPSTSRTP